MKILAVGVLVVLCLIQSVKSGGEVEMTMENQDVGTTYNGSEFDTGILRITGGNNTAGILTILQIKSKFSEYLRGITMNILHKPAGRVPGMMTKAQYKSSSAIRKEEVEERVEEGGKIEKKFIEYIEVVYDFMSSTIIKHS